MGETTDVLSSSLFLLIFFIIAQISIVGYFSYRIFLNYGKLLLREPVLSPSSQHSGKLTLGGTLDGE
ncbi:hypothetical protein FQS90_06730 [Enterococcus casseliflavus]|nr:hypothetical protein [Enterococcus casseliflavus]MBO1142832.1 hypothetical protein [Enterococcus casseliflavus]